MGSTQDITPIQGLDDLLEPFFDALTPRGSWCVGTEAEKFGVFEDGSPIPYDGDRGVRQVLARLSERHGWTETPEYEGGQLIALARGRASITLEPGAQLELSGSPLDTIHQTCSEFRGHMAELRACSEELGIRWLGLGFHPTAAQSQLPWVPKQRYGVMKRYLPTRGSMALDMMRLTATVQANLDFESEDDALRKLMVALRIQPIVTAMFANSPWVEGAATGERSHRARVWLHMDPDRSGLLPFLWNKDHPTFRDYVEWALDVPMFRLDRGATVIKNTGQTFRELMKDGFEGEVATRGDWTAHLNSLFPEARLKRTLEVRGADSQTTDMICALPALWKGLLYDAKALDAVESLMGSGTYEATNAVREGIAERALGAELGGRQVLEWAREIVDISRDGLVRLGNLNGSGNDESVHLGPLSALLDKGQCPADALLERAPDASPASIIAVSEI